MTLLAFEIDCMHNSIYMASHYIKLTTLFHIEVNLWTSAKMAFAAESEKISNDSHGFFGLIALFLDSMHF